MPASARHLLDGEIPATRKRARRALIVTMLVAQAAPASAAGFGTCVADLRAAAAATGISRETFASATTGIEPDQSVLDAMERQPEFTTPIWDYLAALVDDQRVADGEARLREWASILAELERRYGVDRHVVVAVWGVETDYGRRMGGRDMVRSLLTASCFGGRQRFFRGELMATLGILQSGDFTPGTLKGSWAGAFGQTQFMPSTFLRLAVDFDGDGRRDIVGSVPDALASAANFLREAGWESGQPWGYEARLPAGYSGPSGRRNRRPLEMWRRLGIQRADGRPLVGDGPAALLLPAGVRGPAFIVLRNFNVIYSYNVAESYALAIAHLADRLRGGGPFRAAWPTDDPGLSRAERLELQQLLIERGYDIGEADGIIGSRTREAVQAFQESAGLAPDGYAGRKVLEALRSAASAK